MLIIGDVFNRSFPRVGMLNSRHRKRMRGAYEGKILGTRLIRWASFDGKRLGSHIECRPLKTLEGHLQVNRRRAKGCEINKKHVVRCGLRRWQLPVAGPWLHSYIAVQIPDQITVEGGKTCLHASMHHGPLQGCGYIYSHDEHPAFVNF